MNTLISVRYRSDREGPVDDITLHQLIQAGRIRQFYRPSEERWIDIAKDPVRRNEGDQFALGRRATDRKQENTASEPPRRFLLSRLRKPPKAPEPARPLTARDWFDRGFLLLFNSDDVPGAIRAFAMAIRLDPDYARAYLNRGIAYEQLGNLQQAVEDFDKAIRLEPEDGKMYYMRAVAYQRLGADGESLEDMKKAAALGCRSAREILKSKRIDW